MGRSEITSAPAPWVERMTVANRMLAEIAEDPFKASRVWDFAEAARVYAIQVRSGPCSHRGAHTSPACSVGFPW